MFILFMLLTVAPVSARDVGGSDPRGTIVDTARDRNAILCDPVNPPRGPRGEVLDCSGYSNPTPTATPPAPTTVQPTPTSTPGNGGGSNGGGTGGTTGGSSDDPCAPGKSYVGPYCGWSPSSNADDPGPRIGGPAVLGLSYTSSNNFGVSDIILSLGVLCLLLYVKSLGNKKGQSLR